MRLFPDSRKRFPTTRSSRLIGWRATSRSLRNKQQEGIKLATAPQPNYASVVPSSGSTSQSYKVRRGDSLWTIAKKFGVTVVELKQANGLRSSTIRVGQKLTIPGTETDRMAAE
jgi:LysM repeat protein